MNRLRAALPLLLLVAAGIVLFASGVLDRLHPAELVAHQQELKAQLADNPWLGRAAYVGLLTLAVSTGLPGTVLVIFAGGFAFGVAEGTALSSVALTLGSLILYLASRYAFGAGSRHPPRLVERLHHGFERHPVSYTLFLRFIPVAPFGLVTICLAWLRCPLWLFLGATWLGGTVSLVFETSIGAGLGDALRQSDRIGFGLLLHRQVLLPLGAIAVLVLLPLLAQRLLRRRRPG
ncbi:TVP38/TMEM64 family protein [Fulvimonas soli]|uniref:TVP38/TMEM64 family membrane protein n=1 Tax=Fulvimonas soli TaxID=155197 RepID=A0A316IN52_9GAMM|nr:VTT domain-containing protein [Fulvimonas soli]PWK88530.1 putative membrane protein YdjX (TVP38/TMEM64 family) [Fulvimonas soli]TNY27466.1 TVP38/TMEM64 family protein [Fulvimonas soli]